MQWQEYTYTQTFDTNVRLFEWKRIKLKQICYLTCYENVKTVDKRSLLDIKARDNYDSVLVINLL